MKLPSNAIYYYSNPDYMANRMFHVRLSVPVGNHDDVVKFAMVIKSFIRIEVRTIETTFSGYAVDIIFGDQRDVSWFQLKYSDSTMKEMFV